MKEAAPPLAAFDYELPSELIAQRPIEPRDAARLLVAVGDEAPVHAAIGDLPRFLSPGDLLVLNRSRVIPARLAGRKTTGGRREILLVHRLPGDPGAGERWSCLVQGRVAPGTRILLEQGGALEVEACHDDGERILRFDPALDVLAYAERWGVVPLPPYIRRPADDEDRHRYQTVFADSPGSVAAPTAGLHFTPALFERLDAAGILRAQVDLAIGPGTFKPVEAERIEDHALHAEHCHCPAATAAAVESCRSSGGRVIAVGTTSARTLETAARQSSGFGAWEGWTRLFLYPPQGLRVIDGLLTNFHLPRSTLLMLVACLTGVERLRALYHEAIACRYRFYSYGDAMLILPRR